MFIFIEGIIVGKAGVQIESKVSKKDNTHGHGGKFTHQKVAHFYKDL
jgi:hypothetical protein